MAEQTATIAALIEDARVDREAVGKLLEHYRPYLLLISQRQINPKVAVRCSPSDIVQETVAEAYRDFASFRGSEEAEFSVWLGKIHRNNLDDAARKHLLTLRRDAGKEEHLDGPKGTVSITWRDITSDEPTPSDRVVAGEKGLRLAKLLLSLPDSQLEAIRLRHIEGLPVTKIAEQMDRSLQSVAGLLKRGLKALRQKMSEDSWF